MLVIGDDLLEYLFNFFKDPSAKGEGEATSASHWRSGDDAGPV